MFEAVELDLTLSKDDFKKQLEEIRGITVQAQINSRKFPGPIIILISGVDGAGKGELVNFIGDILDIRNVVINTFWRETDEDKERPHYWKFWKSIPSRGQIGIFFGAWYTKPMQDYVENKLSDTEYEHELRSISRFEKMLAEDNAIILKFWMHLSKENQKKKNKKIKKKAKDSTEALKRAMWHYDNYEKIISAAEKAVRYTDRVDARWNLIESNDKRFREMKVLRIITDTLNNISPKLPNGNIPLINEAPPYLSKIDLSPKIKDKDYDDELPLLQSEINELTWEAYRKKVSTMILFEGWDAAGKGGAIRRIVQAIDTRLVQVISVAAPTDEEKSHHYLWRFWRHIPKFGNVTIYDRTWYGRVLVERVENFATFEAWSRSYEEINEFEEQIVSSGIILSKFWIHIDKEEQLRRFKERESISWKNYKITEEDWRNREKWDKYEQAVNEMILRTSTDYAPWNVIAGNDKKYARIEIMKKYIQALTKALK